MESIYTKYNQNTIYNAIKPYINVIQSKYHILGQTVNHSLFTKYKPKHKWSKSKKKSTTWYIWPSVPLLPHVLQRCEVYIICNDVVKINSKWLSRLIPSKRDECRSTWHFLNVGQKTWPTEYVWEVLEDPRPKMTHTPLRELQSSSLLPRLFEIVSNRLLNLLTTFAKSFLCRTSEHNVEMIYLLVLIMWIYLISISIKYVKSP